MTEKYLQYVLARFGSSPIWVWQQYMLIPNCSPPGEDWLADLLAVSRAGYCTEVEIKVSLSDWKRDREKPKYLPPGPLWHPRPPVVKKFYYAGPMKLMKRFEEIWTVPGSGIIAVDPNKEDAGGYPQIRVLREPIPDKTARPLDSGELLSLGRTCMVRYWTWAADKHGDALESGTLPDLAPESEATV